MSEFEPVIVAFCCNTCAFAAADLAGGLRLDYPPNVRIVRLPCSGRVDIREVLDAFLSGADGVLVVGCLEGDCHYVSGNLKAKRRIARARALLAETGINEKRLEFHNLAASMGPQLAALFSRFTTELRALGPAMRQAAGRPASDKEVTS